LTDEIEALQFETICLATEFELIAAWDLDNSSRFGDYSSTMLLLYVRQKKINNSTRNIHTSFGKLREFNTVNQNSFIARTMNSIQINCTHTLIIMQSLH